MSSTSVLCVIRHHGTERHCSCLKKMMDHDLIGCFSSTRIHAFLNDEFIQAKKMLFSLFLYTYQTLSFLDVSLMWRSREESGKREEKKFHTGI